MTTTTATSFTPGYFSKSPPPPPAEEDTAEVVKPLEQRRPTSAWSWAITLVIVAAGLTGAAALLMFALEGRDASSMSGGGNEPFGGDLRGTLPPGASATPEGSSTSIVPEEKEEEEEEEEEDTPSIHLPNIPHADDWAHLPAAWVQLWDQDYSVATTTSLIMRDLVPGTTLPTQLGLLTNLQDLSLSNNFLEGSLPTELGLLTQLTRLSMANTTRLAGPIPSELGLLTSLTGLRLDRQALTGTLPTELVRLTKLQGLYVHYNQLTGTIPEGFRGTQWQQFYAYDNKLTGTIPPSLCGLLEGPLQECFVDAFQLDTSHCPACTNCVGPFC